MANRCEVSFGWTYGQLFLLGEEVEDRAKVNPPLAAGSLVRVVMVSRFGHVGITTNVNDENGYTHATKPENLRPLDGVAYNVTNCQCFLCRKNGHSPFTRTWEIPANFSVHKSYYVTQPYRRI